MDSLDAPGNMGLLDQTMAMQWVYNNIEFFGGDKTKITLFGQSAGAKSVGLHLVSKLTANYFYNAILDSGSPVAIPVITKSQDSIAKNRAFLNFIGCQDVACALKLDANLLLTQVSKFNHNISSFIFDPNPPFSPVVDGYYLLDQPEVLLIKGLFKKCSIITGTNLNEGNMFLKSAFPGIYNSTTPPDLDFITFLRLLADYFYNYPKYPYIASNTIQSSILYRYTNWTNPYNYNSILTNLDHAVGNVI